ncbi:MAG: hypothetical protein HLUCCA12_11165 [Rhodobacteraceae bacterium HLUCCA12]|nr:MAG: hypothetical protein HLUCCA12_11165 [Rhodobacteraceae bacterium HLUCCA12]
MSHRPIAQTLNSLACELETLAALAESIDAAIGHVCLAPGTPPATLASIQRIDLLRQSLSCMAQYTNNLSTQVDSHALCVDPGAAARDLPLRDLALGLATAPEARATDDGDPKRGTDVCFF